MCSRIALHYIASPRSPCMFEFIFLSNSQNLDGGWTCIDKILFLLGNQVQFMMGPLFQAEHLDLASMLQKAPVQANRAIRKKLRRWLCIHPIFYVFFTTCVFRWKFSIFVEPALNLFFWTSSWYMPFDLSTLIWCGCRSTFHHCDHCIAQAKPHVIGLRRESDSWLHFWQTLVRHSRYHGG